MQHVNARQVVSMVTRYCVMAMINSRLQNSYVEYIHIYTYKDTFQIRVGLYWTDMNATEVSKQI
jgi:hypothetical protein